MITATGKRLVRLVAVMLAVTAITFALVASLPGDVAYEIAGRDATPEDVREIRRELGLDQPISVQYIRWLNSALKGDLGSSPKTGEAVLGTLLSRLPVTLELMLVSQVLALALAIPLGIFCAARPGSRIDTLVSTAAFAAMSLPVFIMGILFIWVFAIRLGWLPATGYTPISSGILENIRSVFLPAVSIAAVEWVPLMRVLRSDMIQTLQQDYILMAKATGSPAARILLVHALRPSCLTLVTLLGLHAGHLIGGSVIVETLFALPGIGRLMISAILERDHAVIQGCILMSTLAYVTINAAVDIGYSLIDPKIRRPGSA